MKGFFFILVILTLNGYFGSMSAQLNVETNQTIKQLVEGFIGENSGIEVFNIQFNGVLIANDTTFSSIQAGYFTGGNDGDVGSDGIGMDHGFLLATGNATVAEGPNQQPNAGNDIGLAYQDDDLNNIASAATYNAAVLEFDLIPTGTILTFNYIFASEEYNEYVGSTFNDVFGFFLTGPLENGPPYTYDAQNIAIASDGVSPVAINNVNNGMNSGDYRDNTSNDYDTEFDGLTINLAAGGGPIIVECGKTYHLKLAIADVGDGILDSGVFLEAGSLRSNFEISMDLVIETNGDPTVLYEECGSGYLEFVRVDDLDSEKWFYLHFSGSATNGVDYTLIPDSLMFPANDSLITYDLDGIPDGVIEGIEFADLSLTHNNATCGETTIVSPVGFAIVEAPIIDINAFDPVIGCKDSVLLDPQITGGYGGYSYLWSTGDTSSSIWVHAIDAGTYTLTVNDTCGVVEVVDSFIVSLTPFPPLVVYAGDDDTLSSCLDTLELNGSVTGGDPNYTFLWMNGLDTISDELRGIPISVNETTIFELFVTDGCDTVKSDEVEMYYVDPPPLLVDAGFPDTSYSCLDSILMFGIVSGGTPGYSYEWITDGIIVSTNPFYFAQINEQTTFTFNVVDVCGQTSSDTQILYYFPPPMDVYAGEDMTAGSCDDTLTLDATASGGAGSYTYEWISDNNLISNDSTFDFIITYSQTVVLTVSDQCGDSATDEVVLTSELTPVIPSVVGETEVCYGDPLSFIADASGGAPPYFYLWSDGTVGNELNLIADTSSTYILLVTDYCGTMADTASVYFDVERPIASSSFEYTSEIFVIQLHNTSQPDDLQYYWDFGDLTSSDNFEPKHEFLDSEDHVIILSILTSRGCVDETELLYKAPAMIYIPNAFTPNGDGLNDFISIQGANIKTVKMMIFDRWGEKVHELTTTEDKWYGSRKNGDTEYTSAVFNYVVEWTDHRGESFRQTGSILLIN